MNDYCRGALEALAYVKAMVEELADNPDKWVLLTREVDQVKEDILRGVAVDFKGRIKALSRY